MNKQSLTAQWDHLREIVGISLRLVESLPEDKLDSHPIAKMRTPKELVIHSYGMALRTVLEGAVSGEIKDLDEKTVVPTIKNKTELVNYCRECWKAADQAAGSLTDEKLHAIVKTPWGMEFPTFVAVGVAYDEFLHHRGQLYAYLRALGCDVPMMWDFEHNAPEFQPRQAVKA